MYKYLLILISAILIGCSAIASLQPIQVNYDKFDNSTSFRTSEVVLNETFIFPTTLRAHASKICQGSMVNCDADNIWISFTSFSKDWRYIGLSQIDLTFIADGEVLEAGTAEIFDTDVLTTGGVQVRESMLIALSQPTFMKIAFADTLEGKLGLVEFKVPNYKRDTWRALVNPFVMKKYFDSQ